MIGKMLVPNFGPRKYQAWHGYLMLAVIAVALVLGIVNYFGHRKTPTSDVPSLTWRDLNIENIVTAPTITAPVPAELEITPPASTIISTQPSPNPEPTTSSPNQAPIQLDTLNLAVPFTSQAPTGNWDALHEDACEEASIYMVHEYFAGVAASNKIDPTTADTAITAIVDYGMTKLGDGLSIDAQQVVELITAYYPTFTATIVDNPTMDDIKAALNVGHPILVPAAGRLLGNPNFSGSGPLYHFLVIRGYDATYFITNDPGTRLGQNYNYTQAVLMNAMHDWNGGDPLNGTPRIIIMTPKSQ